MKDVDARDTMNLVTEFGCHYVPQVSVAEQGRASRKEVPPGKKCLQERSASRKEVHGVVGT